jgi:hypothetical protein
LIWIAEDWKERFQEMSQIERLGLMRNPELSMNYVVALLETASEDLNVTREEHVAVLWAAAVNPSLVNGSRRTGRETWTGGDMANPPFKEYGRMWELCLDRWLDQQLVPYLFFKYIQTTPEVKLAAYNRLLEKREGSDYTSLREEVIRSCHPFIDERVLKLAWVDPEEKCRKIARERVGEFTEILGIKQRKRS